MTFDEKRNILLKEALEFQSRSDVKSNFTKEFFSLVERVIINMLKKEESFFGQFMVKIKREIRLDITWPLATVPEIDGFKMYFNPMLFLFCTEKEMGALFKHEIYHIMYSHYDREKMLRKKYSTHAVNLALDISINQFIKNLPMDSIRLDTVEKELNVELSSKSTCEIYAHQIEKALAKRIKGNGLKIDTNDKLCRVVDISKAHNVWEESDLKDDAIREMTKKVATSSYKGIVAKDLEEIIKGYSEKPEISWQQLLKKLIPSLRAGHKKTVTRRNRRQADRLDLRGELPNSIPEILVAIDISASMTDKEVEKIMIEILEITSIRKNKITVLECDSEIRNIYSIQNPKDIKKRSNSKGATKFSPVFKYMKDNNLRNHVLIYFTDGVGEKELEVKPVNKNIIWVLTGDEELSLNRPYGEVKKLKPNGSKIEKGEGGNTALEMMREAIHWWAR